MLFVDKHLRLRSDVRGLLPLPRFARLLSFFNTKRLLSSCRAARAGPGVSGSGIPMAMSASSSAIVIFCDRVTRAIGIVVSGILAVKALLSANSSQMLRLVEH